jgi:hypothetical protein
MLQVFMLVVVLSLLGILGVLYDIASNLRAAGQRLEQFVGSGGGVKPADPHHASSKVIGTFSIWCYEGGTWTLLAHCGQPGCDCGPPPPKPGNYEGQVVRKECAAKQP